MGAAPLLAIVFAGLVGQTGVDHPLVRAGVAAYESLDYSEAVSLLERARAEPLTDRERVVTLETLGSAHVVLGDNAAARAEFAELLHLDPAHTMDDGVSPRIRVVFEEVRAEVRAAIEAEAAAARARDAERKKVDPPPTNEPTKAPVTIDPVHDPAPDLVPPPVEASATPVYREGWFWGVVGGAVGVAVVVVAVALATQSSDGTLVVVPH